MKRGLGRGLDSLFGGFDDKDDILEKKESGNNENSVIKNEVINKIEEVIVGVPKEIDIGLIDRNPEQPRKKFDEDALNELSVEEHYKYYEKLGYENKDIIKQIAKDRNVQKNEIYKQFIKK